MRDAARQRGGQLVVDLDDVQTLELLVQGNRQGARAAADLDHRVAGQGANGVDEPADDGRIVQEVLTEPLLGVHGS